MVSMGPRSGNRGYAGMLIVAPQNWTQLQWVHGPVTVVMILNSQQVRAMNQMLQWVHGPVTVVMTKHLVGLVSPTVASMGPRPRNRGYGPHSSSLFFPTFPSIGPRPRNP